jgi:hypothetical protein
MISIRPAPSSGHHCQAHPVVIREVRRILADHAGPWRGPACGRRVEIR